ncbi:MAG: hypothetical protein A3G76_14475 [Acidobacteria bacterium RIFCSPLOWO2_12_FULL_65_11]|nr:MAG: hypothetical protein A3G76_14475 [Acidobacteria bacterium RIFCSPLOWO2_12_FULL_65_11]
MATTLLWRNFDAQAGDFCMSIEAMPLYVDIERIDNEIRELGRDEDGPLEPAELFPFDQIHYQGTDAVERAIRLLGLDTVSRVLEIGSGVGGPARYLAHTVGCRVTALELQDRLHAISARLTARCGLGDRVTHLRGDALTYPLPETAFDAVVSWLAIHHMPERPRVLARLARTLRPGGRIYIEDLSERAPFTASDLPDVTRTIFGVTLTSADEYVRDLRDAGFVDVAATDMTSDWQAFAVARARAWRDARDRHVRVHGQATYGRLERFFFTVAHLFESGSLGGLGLIGRT